MPGKGGPDEQKQALAKAEGIAKEAKAGKDFAALAKQDSEDLGSKNQGGDLGWLDKGTTDEAFESALFAMKKGDISDPVLSRRGLSHHRSARRAARQRRAASRTSSPISPRNTRRPSATALYADKAGRLTDLTYQDPSTLDSAAKDLGLTVQKTDFFARTGGPGIAANPNVLKAAFSDTVLVQNNNSDPIELGPNHIVVVRIAERKPATPKTHRRSARPGARAHRRRAHREEGEGARGRAVRRARQGPDARADREREQAQGRNAAGASAATP